jgi:hypothetical protein
MLRPVIGEALFFKYSFYVGVPLRVGLFAAILFLPQARHKKNISAAIPNAKHQIVMGSSKLFEMGNLKTKINKEISKSSEITFLMGMHGLGRACLNFSMF